MVTVRVDDELVFAARRLINGANVHRANTLIFQYQQSVAICNLARQSPIHPARFEQMLREWVQQESKRTMSRESL